MILTLAQLQLCECGTPVTVITRWRTFENWEYRGFVPKRLGTRAIDRHDCIVLGDGDLTRYVPVADICDDGIKVDGRKVRRR